MASPVPLLFLLLLQPAPATTSRPLPPPPDPVVFVAPDKPTAIVLHLPGISGIMPVDRRMIRGLREGLESLPGSRPRIEAFDWPYYDKGLGALMNERANRALSHNVAAWITAAARARPDLPLYLTSHSGGGGVLLWALELLPTDVTVDQVLFLAPAVSPTYDLSPALRHVRGNAYVFSSPADTVLKMTTAFGTIDRKFTTSAGVFGFVTPTTPPPADPNQYGKLVHRPYLGDYMKFDNLGDHIGSLEPAFSKSVLSALLTPAPSKIQSTQPGLPVSSTRPARP